MLLRVRWLSALKQAAGLDEFCNVNFNTDVRLQPDALAFPRSSEHRRQVINCDDAATRTPLCNTR